MKQYISRFPVLAASATFAILVLTSCALAPPPTPATETVRVYAGPFLGSSPFYFARDRGYFADLGINVELVELKSSLDAVPAVAQGDIDVVISSANVALFNTMARGGQIRLVGGFSFWDPEGCPSHGLLGRTGLDLEAVLSDPAKARDLRVATGALGMEGFYVDAFLNRYGLALQDLQVQDIPPPAIGEALAQDGLDLANAAEPWITRILKEGDSQLVTPASAVLPGMPITVMTYGKRMLDTNGDLGQRFMRAVVAGIRDYQEGQTAENTEDIASFTGLEHDLVREVCWPSMPADGSLDAQWLVDFEEWAYEQGALDKVLPPEAFYDSRFVEAAADSRENNE